MTIKVDPEENEIGALLDLSTLVAGAQSGGKQPPGNVLDAPLA
jgi:hypothetical protein